MLWDGWKTPLVLVSPETVIRWHRQGFKLYWRRKSRTRKTGRPTIPDEHIEFIRRMSRDNPTWGEDKINEELRVKFGISHSSSTIRKYMVRPRPRDDGQTWRTFIKNHSHEPFACDFMTQYTALFATIYVFVVMEISTRRSVLCNVTESPTLDWVKIQIRNITAFNRILQPGAPFTSNTCRTRPLSGAAREADGRRQTDRATGSWRRSARLPLGGLKRNRRSVATVLKHEHS